MFVVVDGGGNVDQEVGRRGDRHSDETSPKLYEELISLTVVTPLEKINECGMCASHIFVLIFFLFFSPE